MTKTFKIMIGVLIITVLGVLLISIPNRTHDNGNIAIQPVEEEQTEPSEEIEEIVPSEDIDTTNWKTYRNEEYGFSFKYPEGWEIENWEGINLFIYHDAQKKNEEKIKKAIAIHSAGWRDNMPEGGGSFIIYDLDIKNEDFIKKYNNDDDKISQINSESKEELLDGKKVSHVTTITAIGLNEEYLIFEDTLKKPFIISYQEFDSFHKKILSTFKFLN